MLSEKYIPKRIVSDLDGVLGDVTPGIITAINEAYGTQYSSQDWISWDWPVEQLASLAQLEPAVALTWLFSIPHFERTIPITSAQEVLQYWHSKGTEMYVATSRSPESKHVTLQWLNHYYPFIPTDNIFIRENNTTKGSTFKREILERIQPDMYFEDEPAMVLSLVTIWPQQMQGIIRVIDQPWNRNIEAMDAFRIAWEEIDRS